MVPAADNNATIQRIAMMVKKTALVLGGTGIAGSSVVRNLKHDENQDWNILVLSNAPKPDLALFDSVEYVQVDAFNTEALRTKLRNYEINIMFYSAAVFKPNMDWFPATDIGLRFVREINAFTAKIMPALRRTFNNDDLQKMFCNMVGMADGGTNLQLFSSVMEVVMEHPIEHVCAITGGRYYGSVFMGPGLHDYVIPFREDFPRLAAETWYYQVEDHLMDCADKGGFTWSVVRPSTIIGYAEGSPFNFGTALGVYASLMKELGRPLVFPGMMKAYNAQVDHTSAELLARQMIWSCREEQAMNEAFNCVNADRAKWSDVWLNIGQFFDMPIELKEGGISVESIVIDAEKSGLWDTMIARHGLRKTPLRSLMPPNCIDSFMMIDWDQPYAIEKSRAAGFTETINSSDMFHQLFGVLRNVRAIP
jgi:nucleoside-diphosphate-sugar epimerase